MDQTLNQSHRSRVQEFLRKHRIGLLTLLFTDIVGSTKLKQVLGDAAAVMHIKQHHQLLRDLLKGFAEAEEISTAGDSFFVVFARPSDALRFSLLLQSRLRKSAQESGVPVLDRIGIHVGEVVIDESGSGDGGKDLYGMQVDNCARLMSLAEGDQILMSRVVFDNARQVLRGQELQGMSELSWLNHGAYLMKGIEEPLEVCEVGEMGKAVLAEPKDTEKARRHSSASGELVPGWRPALGQTTPGSRWVLEEKLGEGAFGEVWLARHQTLKDQRVLKFCFRADRVRSLKREATIFKILRERAGNHPGIVTVHDLYLDEPPYYLVMDYVPGRDLKAWCARQGGLKAVPIDVRLSLVADVADALQAAHEAGIIHRDIKPTNVLVAEDRLGTVYPSDRSGFDPSVLESRTSQHPRSAKLTDFGIGQATTDEALAGLTQLGFTQTLMSPSSSGMAGTQTYMAPEVLAGKPATTRSDIYSLGVVLYQMIAGAWDRHLTMDWQRDVEDQLLREDLARCFAGDARERFAGPGELARRIRSLDQRRAEQKEAAAMQAARERAAYRRGMVRIASVSLVIIALFGTLATFAFRTSRNEIRERLATQLSLVAAQRNLHVANMILVQRAWEENKIGLISQLLEESAAYPGRGFEWYYWQRQTHLALKTLRGHLMEVSSVAFSPDGQRIVTGSYDATASVWDAATGRELLTLKGHSKRIESVAFSPDGIHIVTASDDQTAKVWEAGTGRETLTFRVRNKGRNAQIHTVAFFRDGQPIVSGSEDETAKLWEVATGRELLTLKGQITGMSFLAISPDGRRIITGTGDSTAKVWEADTGRELLTLKGHGDSIDAASFSPDGQRILTGSYDHTAKVWDASTGRELLTLKGHSSPIRAVAFSPDCQRIVTGSMEVNLSVPDGDVDKTARVWDASTGQELFALKGHTKGILSVTFSPDGQLIVTGSEDKTAKVWEASAGREVRTLNGHTNVIGSVAFSPNGRQLVTGSWDQMAKVWEAAVSQSGHKAGRELLTLSGHSNGISSVGISPDFRSIVTGSFDKTAKVWETVSGRELLSLKGHSDFIRSVAFSPQGHHIATGSDDKTAKVWEAATGRELRSLQGHTGGIQSVAFSPDGQRLVTGSWDEKSDQTAKVWEVATGRELLTFMGHPGHPGGIFSVAFSPDGRRIVTGSHDRTARVWEAATGQILVTLKGHSHRIRSVAFSPDGQRIVTGSEDNTAKVWEAATGRELLTLRGHGDSVKSVAFSPDGQRIVTGSDDQTAKIWEAATPQQVAAWQQEENADAERLERLRREQAASLKR